MNTPTSEKSVLRRQTHHFCVKCRYNLKEYRQEECDYCGLDLTQDNSVLNENEMNSKDSLCFRFFKYIFC